METGMNTMHGQTQAWRVGAHADYMKEARQAASRWNPYVNNGGTCCGVAGETFAVLAADTRMSLGYSIQSRAVSKCIQLTDKAVLTSSGMQADIVALHKMLTARIVMYKHNHGKDMSLPSIAHMLSNVLYGRRFFPYYTFNVLGGIDDDGKGAIFSYDAIGSYERNPYSTSGTGTSLVQPLFDNQVSKRNQVLADHTPLPEERVVEVVKDALTSAGERDIYTGDDVDIFIVNADGVRRETFALKQD